MTSILNYPFLKEQKDIKITNDYYIKQLMHFLLRENSNISLDIKSPLAESCFYDEVFNKISVSNAYFEKENYFEFSYYNFVISFFSEQEHNSYRLPNEVIISRKQNEFYFPNTWINYIKLNKLFGKLHYIKDDILYCSFPSSQMNLNDTVNLNVVLKHGDELNTINGKIVEKNTNNNIDYFGLELEHSDYLIEKFKEYETTCLDDFINYIEQQLSFYLMTNEYKYI